MKQIVKTKDCENCKDKCCRFAPDLLEFSPVFSEEEYINVIKKGHKKSLFKKTSEKTYQLVFSKKEKGYYLCPLLKDKVWCSIYDVEPYYCKIWPFGLMKKDNKIFLVLDEVEDCHAISKISKERMKKYIKYLKEYLQTEELIRFFKKNPSLIKKYDSDFTLLEKLDILTKELGGT